MTSDGTFTYTYNSAGRMVRAESITSTFLYTYTADGLRVAQSVQSVPESVDSFAWDTASALPQALATSDGALYLYGLDLVAQQQSDAWQYPLVDALGSIRQWTDDEGTATYAAGYTPFGEELWQTGSAASAWGYTGEWQDADVGLLYLRARWYDGATGRFTSKDPWEGEQEQPLTMNPYLYTLAHPTDYVDPSGSVVERPGIPEDFQYSCRCGWIDWGHAGPGAAYNLITKVLAEPPNNAGHTVISVGMSEGFVVFSREYVINEEKDNIGTRVSRYLPDTSDVWKVALGIYKDLSEHFEAWQAHWWDAPTSFSEEDLPSDLIGFHVAMREMVNYFVLPNPDPTISAEERVFVRHVCDCVDQPGDDPYGGHSLDVFDAYGESDWQKVRDWNYPHIDFDDGCIIPTLCVTSLTQRSWPGVFSIPAPAPMGRLFGYFWEYDPSIDGAKGSEVQDQVWQLGGD